MFVLCDNYGIWLMMKVFFVHVIINGSEARAEMWFFLFMFVFVFMLLLRMRLLRGWGLRCDLSRK